MNKQLRENILAAYEFWDDDDVSTEQLLALISDETGADVSIIASVLSEEYGED